MSKLPQTGLLNALGIEAVIFDVDGLIFDTEQLYLDTWPMVGEKMGLPITVEMAFETTGWAAKESEAIFRNHLGDDFCYVEAKRHMVPLLTERIEQNGMPFRPGAKELIKLLHGKNIPLGVGTSNMKENVDRFFDAAEITPYFTAISTVDLAGRAKPAPDIYLLAAKMLGLPPEKCLALDDSPIGIEAAYRAGCVPIMVPDLLGPTEESKQQALYILDSLGQLPTLLF